ncbi:MAG: hypothetical protein HYY30_10340 [Chloroflexi bacterium]|nr:hypothetical protein [Chloroflexota bacterium]
MFSHWIGRHWSLRRTLALVIVANLLLGLILFTLRSPSRGAPDENAPVPPLPQQVQQVKTLIAEGRHGEKFSMVLTDQDLTDLVAHFLAADPSLPFTQVRVAVTGQRLVIDAITRGLAVTLPVRVTGTVGARNGLPWARVENVSLGDTPVPGFIRDQIVGQVNAGLDFSRYDLGVSVDALELGAGTMAIRGTVK